MNPIRDLDVDKRLEFFKELGFLEIVDEKGQIDRRINIGDLFQFADKAMWNASEKIETKRFTSYSTKDAKNSILFLEIFLIRTLLKLDMMPPYPTDEDLNRKIIEKLIKAWNKLYKMYEFTQLPRDVQKKATTKKMSKECERMINKIRINYLETADQISLKNSINKALKVFKSYEKKL